MPVTFRTEVVVLDGGLATELEARGCDISGSLWSARVLRSNPEAIEQLALRLLRRRRARRDHRKLPGELRGIRRRRHRR
jgi:hypothetical protein